jgi:hypothetical protein
LRGTKDDRYADLELGENPAHASPGTDSASDVITYESDNPELGLDDRDLDGWEDVETDSGRDSDDLGEHGSPESEEEDFGGM